MRVGAPPATAPGGVDNDSSSSSWLAVGEEIERSRAELRARVGVDPAVPSDVEVSQLGPYLSQPIDVEGPGEYAILAGPLSGADSARLRRDESGLAGYAPGVSLPPDVEDHFTLVSVDLPEVRVVERDGRPYVEIPVRVSEVAVPYRGLRVWVD